MFESLEEFASDKLKALESIALKRELLVSGRERDAVVWRDGKRFVSFSCNDYLNLSTHPDVISAAVAATQKYGVGAGASPGRLRGIIRFMPSWSRGWLLPRERRLRWCLARGISRISGLFPR